MPEVSNNDIPFNRTARSTGERGPGPSSEHRVNQIIEELTTGRSPGLSEVGPTRFPKALFIICLLILAFWVLVTSTKKSEDIRPASASSPTAVNIEPSPDEKAKQLYDQGVQLNQNSKFNEAVLVFSEVVKIWPEHPYAHHNLAHAYEGVGNLDQALEIMSKAITLDSSDSQHFFCRGKIYFNSENYQTALEDFQRAVNIRSDYAEGYYMLAKTYEKMGDIESAISTIGQAINLEPYIEKYTACLKDLEGKKQLQEQ